MDERTPYANARYGKEWDPTRHYQNADVATDYDRARFSSVAGRLFNFFDKRALRRALVGLPPGSRIADVPCGTGRLAEVLLESGFTVHGIDIASAMLDVARARLGHFGDRFTAEVSDIGATTAGRRRFHAVLSARFLMHFPLAEQAAMIAAMAAMADARLILTQGITTPFQRLRRAVKRRLGLFQNPAAFPVTNAEMAAMLEAAGWREIRRHRVLPVLSEATVIVAAPLKRSLSMTGSTAAMGSDR